METHFHLTYDTIVKYQQNLDSIDEYFEAFFDYMGAKEQGTTVDDSYLYFSTFDKLSTIPSIVAMIEKCLCFSLISLFIVKETFDFLDELLDKLYYYFKNDRYYSIDYRMVVSKKTSTTAPEIIKLLFLCMNSKVIFDDLTEAHSVILTSGIFICFSY